MFKDRLIFVSVVLSAILNIILWLALGSKFGWSEARVPLHFNVVYGIDYLGKSWEIYEIPLVGLVLLAVNTFLAAKLYLREKLFSYFLSFGSVAIQLILIIAGAVLFVLND